MLFRFKLTHRRPKGFKCAGQVKNAVVKIYAIRSKIISRNNLCYDLSEREMAAIFAGTVLNSTPTALTQCSDGFRCVDSNRCINDVIVGIDNDAQCDRTIYIFSYVVVVNFWIHVATPLIFMFGLCCTRLFPYCEYCAYWNFVKKAVDNWTRKTRSVSLTDIFLRI